MLPPSHLSNFDFRSSFSFISNCFVKFEEGIVYVKMTGMCDGCPLAGLTLKSGVEELLKARVKEVKEVRAV